MIDQSQFKDPSLLDHRSFIGGEWVESSSKATFAVFGLSPRMTVPTAQLLTI